MKLYKNLRIIVIGLLIGISCETIDLDLLDDPNNLPFEALDINLTMNHIQRQLGQLVQDANLNTEGLTRMRHSFNSTWNGMARGTSARGTSAWSTYYSDIYPEANLIIEASQDEVDPKPFLEAVSKTIRAYGAMLLVDLYGNIPYSEAGQFFDNPNPALDNDQDVYASAFADLISAKEIFDNGSGSFGFDDFYYNGSKSKWGDLVNTLLFKYYLNLSSTGADYSNQMNDLIADGLIESSSNDFEWKYSESDDPESRHPDYESEYTAPSVGRYMSNYYMWVLNNEKVVKGITTNPDPRTRFYFFRQSLTIPGPNDIPTTQQVLPCLSASRPAAFDIVDPTLPFCVADEDNVYWGRDLFNVDGIGPENELRTTYSAYPIGGRFDDNTGNQVQGALAGPRNLNGAGISPIMLSSFVYFMRAEAALQYGTSDDASAMLQAGIENSLDKVYNFGDIPQNNVDEAELALYTDEVMAHYSTAPDKLDVIAKEYLIALWGNGYEAYNMYRRTGKPLNLQPGIQPSGDEFPRSFFYPANSVSGNNSINQKEGTAVGPFWFNNSVSLD